VLAKVDAATGERYCFDFVVFVLHISSGDFDGIAIATLRVPLSDTNSVASFSFGFCFVDAMPMIMMK